MELLTEPPERAGRRLLRSGKRQRVHAAVIRPCTLVENGQHNQEVALCRWFAWRAGFPAPAGRRCRSIAKEFVFHFGPFGVLWDWVRVD